MGAAGWCLGPRGSRAVIRVELALLPGFLEAVSFAGCSLALAMWAQG